jgi:hypothetical protein
VLAAGWHISLTGPARDDVRIAGRQLTLAAPIAGDLTAAGADVSIEPATQVSGRTWLTGATLNVNGVFEREVRLAGGTVRLGGEFRQPVQIVAEKLEVLPSARVLAPLSYKSPNPATISGSAVMNGPVSYTAVSQREARQAHAFRVVSSVFFAINLIVAGALLFWLLPRVAGGAVSTLRSVPGRSLLLGLALFVGVPFAALVLVLSLVGAPVGLSVAALYAVALLVGLVTSAFRVGEWEAHLFGGTDLTSLKQRAVMLVAGVVTLSVLRAVPVFGTLVVFVSIVFGLGALVLSFVNRPAAGTTAPA